MSIRIGIIGTGRIAQKFVEESHAVSAVKVIGAYNPHAASTVSFCNRMKLDMAFPSLPLLFDCVDAVYIASPHFTHKSYCMQALTSGVHVLCEKPLAVNPEEVGELFALARSKKTILLEGIKTAFYPGFEAMERFVREGHIGDVVAVDAAFTKLISGNVPELSPESGGSMLWLGTYPLYAISRFLGQTYSSLTFYSKKDADGVDLFTRGVVGYADGSASFMVGFGAKTDGSLVITGTEGFVRTPAPWWNTRSFSVGRENSTFKEEYTFDLNGYGLRYELETFASMITEKHLVSARIDENDCRFIANVMQDFLC